jgi:uncharacterized membrane protein
LSWAAAAAALLMAAALGWLAATGTPLGVHTVIAIVLAATVSMLVGALLMGLMFHSSESGHDAAVAESSAAAAEPDAWRDL